MNFKEFYNPRHVYEGYFETYFIRPFFHQYADFRGRESGKSALLSFCAWFIVTLGIIGLLMGQVGLLGPEVGFSVLLVVGSVWGGLSFIPLVSLLTRLFRGKPEKEVSPRFLGVDTLLGVSSLLFFVLGLLMMVTTVNSGVLHPDAGVSEEDEDTSSVKLERVTEEPIFTYQDEEVATSAATDTLSDMTEPDLVEQEESFDPTLQQPEEEVVNDSIYF